MPETIKNEQGKLGNEVMESLVEAWNKHVIASYRVLCRYL